MTFKTQYNINPLYLPSSPVMFPMLPLALDISLAVWSLDCQGAWEI